MGEVPRGIVNLAFLDELAELDTEGDGWVIAEAEINGVMLDEEQHNLDEADDNLDEGIDEDVDDEPRDVKQKGKYVHNSSPPDAIMYCTTTAYVIIDSVYGSEHKICEICYLIYSERVTGEHRHMDIHTTSRIEINQLLYCKCCRNPLYQLRRLDVCNICNNH